MLPVSAELPNQAESHSCWSSGIETLLRPPNPRCSGSGLEEGGWIHAAEQPPNQSMRCRWVVSPRAMRDGALILHPESACWRAVLVSAPLQSLGGTLRPPGAEQGGGSGSFTVKAGACWGKRPRLGWASQKTRNQLWEGEGDGGSVALWLGSQRV